MLIRMIKAAKVYDYLTLTRQKLFEHARSLSAEEYTRVFAIGLGSLARTFTHTMMAERMYARRLQGLDVPPYSQWPIRDENPLSFSGLESEWTRQAPQTRAVLASITDWETELEYRFVDHENGQAFIINATRGDICTQLLLHEVHHRAQAMNMLRHLGRVVEDLDYNALMYRRRPAAT